MLFNSYIFVFVFLPLCILGYFLLNHFGLILVAQGYLLGMSLWFYGYFNTSYLIIMVASILGNYILYLLLNKIHMQWFRKIILLIGVLGNIGVLFYFKYFDFFITNINQLFHVNYALRHVILPLGISFFTFQQLSFVIDSYKGEVPRYDLLQYATFVTFFPQLIAGPIVTHDELIPQFYDREKKKFNWDSFSIGLYIFSMGMAKKILLADTFGNAVNIGFSAVDKLDSTNALLCMLAYTIQIYFDFSGYCDMAIGIGKMLNIDLPLNFNSPYKALTINEFWKRWHMTLTRFFTHYIYIPLGGNRKGKYRTYLNIMIVYLVSGIWHGADWSFILWGVMHGVFCVIERHFHNFFKKLHPVLNWLLTFGFVNVAWVFFRADTIRDAVTLLKKIGMMKFGAIQGNIVKCFNLPELTFLDDLLPFHVLKRNPRFFLIAFFVSAILILLGFDNVVERSERSQKYYIKAISSAVFLIWCIFSLSGVSTFLYFNF